MTVRIAMILPGLGRVQRGAEVAFIEVARALSQYPDTEVELFGSGTDAPYGLTIHDVGCVRRERFENWVNIPCFRNEYQYEEFTFAWKLRRNGLFRPQEFDVTISCTYPHVNWFLQRTRRGEGPLNIFVTQNGDWMCHTKSREYRYFDCDGLVCINPEDYERNVARFPSALIGNGVRPENFMQSPRSCEGSDQKSDIPAQLQIRHNGPIILMVSALIESKRVDDAIHSVAQVSDACLIVAGDGPQRDELTSLAQEKLPHRHVFFGSVPAAQMTFLYEQADAFLHMSQIEPFGIVYLEAASAGLPIVTHDAPNQRWILGETALFNDSSDHTGIAQKLRVALDPAVGLSFGQRAKQRVISEFTWDAQARKYRTFMDEVLKRNRRPSFDAAASVSEENEAVLV